MNFLELCQRTRQECGISGGGPASVTGQTGVYVKLIAWVNDAWREIQQDHKDWLFMWDDFGFDTIVNTPEYTTTDLTVRDFSREPLVLYHKATGLDDRGFIPYLKYADYKARYADKNTPAARPICWTVTPKGAIRLYPKPDDVYGVEGDGQLKIQTLVDNTDSPIMPEQFHMAIVWLACKKWFDDQEATQRMNDMERNYLLLKDELLRDQLPQIDWGFASL